MDIQNILQVIKDYGAAIISTISVGSIAAVVAIIAKIKKAFDTTKEAMQKTLAKKDKALEDSSAQVSAVIEQNKQLLGKIDDLTMDVYHLKGEVRDVKGDGKN